MFGMQRARQGLADLTLSKQRAVEYSSRTTACETELLKVSEELEYALSDLEALIARSGVASLRTALVIAAGLALAVLLTAAYIHVLGRRIVSLRLEREKLLLDKVEAEAGIRSVRGRSMRVEGGRLHD